MRRIFGKIHSGSVIIDEETLHHLKVIRVNTNEKIEVVDEGKIYQTIVTSINPLKLELVGMIDVDRELRKDLVMFLPLLKNGNFELCLQKATELGVKRIIPYLSNRTVVKLKKEEFLRKKERYNKIISGAALQSNRNIVPILNDLVELKDLKNFDFDKKFVAYEDESLKANMIDRNEDFSQDKSIAIVIGCEGGFEKSEVDYLCSLGYRAISLGRRILRAETAVIYALSILSYLVEEQ